MDRQKASILVLVCLILTLTAWWLFSDRGLITINVKDAPVASVVKSIQRQSGVRLVTNMPPESVVTMKVKRVPLAEAMDVLAARTDSQWRFAWLLAPSKTDISNALAQVPNGRVEGWREFEGGRGMGMMTETSPDPRQFEWKPETPTDGKLQPLLDQAAQKTGLLFAAPEAWDPNVAKLPPAGLVSKSIPALAKSIKGTAESAIFLTTFRRPQRQQQQAGEAPRERNFAGGGGGRLFAAASPRARGQVNQAWAEERMEQQIRGLPKEERAEIKRDLDEMRKFWQEVRDLPEDQRRAKIREMMDRPEVQERMEERMAAAASRHSPQQRLKRYSRYVERKKKIKETGAPSR